MFIVHDLMMKLLEFKREEIKQMRRGMVLRTSLKLDYFLLSNVGCSIEEVISMKHRILRKAKKKQQLETILSSTCV